MPDGINIKIEGLDKAMESLRGAGPKMLRHLARGLYAEAEAVMTRSKEEFVPVVTGALRSSGHVQPPEVGADSVRVVLGFGGPSAPYAVIVHENPRAGKTGGVSPKGKPYQRYSQVGQWKYLETPLLEAQDKIRRVIETAPRQGFERA